MKIMIAGLGLIGGSMAKSLARAGYSADGFGRAPVLRRAEEEGVVARAAADTRDYDVVFVALPPDAAMEYIGGHPFREGAVVADICGVKGDSVLEDERVSEKFCSTSTVVALPRLVGIVGQVIQNLADLGVDPPIWVSGNLDRGDEINAEHIRKYRGKVDIL